MRGLPTGDDFWQRAVCATALLRSDHPEAGSTARRWLDEAVDAQTSDGRLCYGGVGVTRFDGFDTSTVSATRDFRRTALSTGYFGTPLLDLHERTGEDRYLAAAVRQADAILAGPRGAAGFLMMNAARPELWIDSVYPMGFLARLGALTGEATYADEAHRQLRHVEEHLVDHRTGLVRHLWLERPDSYPDGCFWSRGTGWHVAALAEVVEALPGHAEAGRAGDVLAGLLTAVVARQDATGLFHDVLDDPGSPLESSGTLLIAYALALAGRLGLVGADRLDVARRALAAVARLVEPDGTIGRTSLPPGGPGCPLGKLPLTQGLFLLAAHHLGGPG